MGVLQIIDNTVKMGIDCGRFYLDRSGTITNVPMETLDEIQVYGKPQITTQCMEECLKRGIPMLFYTQYGMFLGGFFGKDHTNASRQRLQALFALSDAAMDLSRKIIQAKIGNQITVLRRHQRTSGHDASDEIRQMYGLQKKAGFMNARNSLMGCEGAAARLYFSSMGQMVDADFSFTKRTQHPPKDRFNSLLSFGYSLLHKEIHGIMLARGLNPYMGFIHCDRLGHAALVSDLIEEWRPVIVDSLVLGLVDRHRIMRCHFENNLYLTQDGKKIFLETFQKKLGEEVDYLNGSQRSSVRNIIQKQIGSFVQVLEKGDVTLYEPVRIR